MTQEQNSSKMREGDRILSLKPIEGKSTTTNMGLVDNTLFKTGGNRLHAVLDEMTTLWSIRYEKGITPEPLRHKFTSFNKLRKHAEEYFLRRNIEIVEVID